MAPITVVSLLLPVVATAQTDGTELDLAFAENGALPPLLLEQIAGIYAEKAGRTPAQQKIEFHLLRLVNEGAAESLIVEVHGDVNGDLVPWIEQHDGVVSDAAPKSRSVRAHIPAEALESIAALDAVQTVYAPTELLDGPSTSAPLGRPDLHQPTALDDGRPAADASAVGDSEAGNTVVSQGDSAHRSDEARETYSLDGTGIGIAVIDTGVRYIERSQASGELPKKVTVLPGYAGPRKRSGTGLLEILHDIAPGADLHFATGYNGAYSYAGILRAFRRMGVDIVVDGINVFAEPAFQAGRVEMAYKEAIDHGMVVFAAAGNQHNFDGGTSGTWEGDYREGPIVELTFGGRTQALRTHAFEGNTYRNPLTKATNEFGAWLKWSDPDFASSNDYDLFEINPRGRVVNYSVGSQSGVQRPYERLTRGVQGGNSLVVVKYRGEARHLRVMAYGGTLTYNTPGAAWGHDTLPEIMSVAAVESVDSDQATTTHFSTENTISTVSSDGPRRIFYEHDGTPITPGNLLASGGRVINKPDFAGAHRVSTSVPEVPAFAGTSSAAAHVAGIAALMMEAAGGPGHITREQLKKAMIDSAIDISTPGYDRNSGHGIVQALDAVRAVHNDSRNRTPEILGQPHDILGSVGADLTVDLAGFVHDPDDDELAFRVSIEEETGAITSSLAGAVVTFASAGPSSARARVAVKDPGGFERYLYFGVSFRPSVALTVDPTEVSEGASSASVRVTATLSATRTEDTEVRVTVGSDGDSAMVGADYQVDRTPTLTIESGATKAEGTFTLQPTNDVTAEGAERITVGGSADDLEVGSATVTLNDDDDESTAASLTVDPLEVVESAGSRAVHVTGSLNGGARTTDTVVAVAVGSSSDTAVEGTDYAEVGAIELRIPANRTAASATFTLRPMDDAADEERETISVSGEAAGLAVAPAELALVDDDASTRLSSLSLSGVDIGAFDPATLSYSASASVDVGTTTVTAVAGDARAAVSITPADADARSPGHQVALAAGTTEIAATVTAVHAAASRSYRVAVTRAASDDATLSSLSLADVDLGGFDAETTGYEARVSNAVSSTAVSAVPSHGSASVEISDARGSTAGAERRSALVVGGNRIEVSVTAEDGTTRRTYAVAVTREAPLTGRFAEVPSRHDGSSPSRLRLAFSAPVATSYRTLRDEAFEVSGGEVRGAHRVNGRSDLWEIEAAPATSGDLAVVLPATADCAAPGAVCTGAGTPLSAPARATVPGPAARPRVSGVPQVGATLAAAWDAEDAGASEAAYEWLRDGAAIAGAGGREYAASAADEGASLSVRATRAGLARTSAGTVPVWGPPGNPAVGADEEELFATLMTVGSTDAYPLRLGGYGRLSRADFGSLDATALALDGTDREVTGALINDRGEFTLTASPALGAADGVTVLWDGHRIGPLSAGTSAGEGAYWTAPAPQPPAEYRRYTGGGSDGVRVALSVRRALGDPAATVAAVDESVVEGEAAVFEVALERASAADVAVSVSVVAQAEAGAGGVLSGTAPASATVAAGSTVARLSVATADDRVVEAAGTVTATLAPGAGYALGGETSATVAVADDDEAVFEVAASPPEVAEGETSTLTVTIGDGVTFASGRPLGLSVTGDVSPSDYALAGGALELPAGAGTASTTFEALADGEDGEGEETARIGVSLDGAEVGSAEVAIRAPSADAALADLSLADVEMEAFDPETTSYAGTAPGTVSSTTVAAVPSHGAASVEISDARGSTLGRERTSALAAGENAIEARVTAEDGVTERTYAVTVTRAPSWGTRLPDRDVVLGRGEWSGVWSDGETLWAVSYWGVGVRAYELATGARRAGRDIALDGSREQHAALWSDGSTLWASSLAGGATAHRLRDGARAADADLDAQLSAAGNDAPTGLWSDGSTLYVVDHADARVYAYGADGARLESREFGLRGDGIDGWMWGLWSDGGTLLTSSDNNGRVLAYRLPDGVRQPERDIDAGSSGNRHPRGLWSDGEVLWVADAAAGRLYAYAVPGLRAGAAPAGLLPVRVSSRARPVPSGDAGPAVAVPDAGLRGRIALALGKAADAVIGANELAALVALDARDAGIRELAGLGEAANLAALDLGGNPLTDLRELALLPRLRTLNLDRTGADAWAVSRLTGLERLSLRGNGIADVSPLAALGNLAALDVGGNPVGDLELLRRIAGLAELRADGNAVAGVAPPGARELLETRNLRDNGIVDRPPLADSPARADLGGYPANEP